MTEGRPSIFSETIADDICERLADGESLRSICCDAALPSQRTVIYWLAKGEAEPDKYPEFALFLRKYTRARELQADTLFDEILDVADDGSNDWMQRKREDGSIEEVVNSEHLQRSRLRVDARKWMASKLLPKKYGDKLDVTSGGERIGLAESIAAGRARVASIAPDA